MRQRKLELRTEFWPLAQPFTISRGTKTEAEVLVVEVSENGHIGRGECVPYAHYGETMENVREEVVSRKQVVEDGMERETLLNASSPGAGRNALDAALWDLEAKLKGLRVWDLAEVPEPKPTLTAQTISIGDVDRMGQSALDLGLAPLIKVKLNAFDVVTRMTAVRLAQPKSRLIADANEAWDMDLLLEVAPALADLGVEMIEQPLPAGEDKALAGYESPVLLCADESCHILDDLKAMAGKYGMVNIKLDKTGGLTEALSLARAAEANGTKIMVGCMVATSLAMAPAMMLASFAEFVDLDGPLLLKDDREDGLIFESGYVHPPKSSLWG